EHCRLEMPCSGSQKHQQGRLRRRICYHHVNGSSITGRRDLFCKHAEQLPADHYGIAVVDQGALADTHEGTVRAGQVFEEVLPVLKLDPGMCSREVAIFGEGIGSFGSSEESFRATQQVM